MDLGAPELLIILAVVFLLFGARKLPDLAKALGQAKREFAHAEGEPVVVPVAVPAATVPTVTATVPPGAPVTVPVASVVVDADQVA